MSSSLPIPLAPGGERMLFVLLAGAEPAAVGPAMALFDAVAGLAIPHALLCIVDGGDDAMLAAARRALDASRVEHRALIRNHAPYGVGGAHKVAFDHARAKGFDHLAIVTCDSAGALADLIPLIRLGEHHQVDALLGARFMRGARAQGCGIVRRIGHGLAQRMVSLAMGQQAMDVGARANVYRRAPFDGGFHLRLADDETFCLDVMLAMARAGRRLRFVPVAGQWRGAPALLHRLRGLGAALVRHVRARLNMVPLPATARTAYPYTLAAPPPQKTRARARQQSPAPARA